MSNYTLQLQAFQEMLSRHADLIVHKIVLDVGTRIVERSPVGDGKLWKNPPPKGYIGGRFRANWQYGNSIAGVPRGDLPDIDPSGEASLSRIEAGLPATGAAGINHVLINNLPYAQRLEDGWSSQAPAGMVGLVVEEFSSLVNDAAQEVNS